MIIPLFILSLILGEDAIIQPDKPNPDSPIWVYHPKCKVQFTVCTEVSTNWVTVQDNPPPNVGFHAVMAYGSQKQVGYVQTNLVSFVNYFDGDTVLFSTKHIIKLIGKDEWPTQKRTTTYPQFEAFTK